MTVPTPEVLDRLKFNTELTLPVTPAFPPNWSAEDIAKWDPHLHPRGPDGRFIRSLGDFFGLGDPDHPDHYTADELEAIAAFNSPQTFAGLQLAIRDPEALRQSIRDQHEAERENLSPPLRGSFDDLEREVEDRAREWEKHAEDLVRAAHKGGSHKGEVVYRYVALDYLPSADLRRLEAGEEFTYEERGMLGTAGNPAQALFIGGMTTRGSKTHLLAIHVMSDHPAVDADTVSHFDDPMEDVVERDFAPGATLHFTGGTETVAVPDTLQNESFPGGGDHTALTVELS